MELTTVSIAAIGECLSKTWSVSNRFLIAQVSYHLGQAVITGLCA